VRQIFPMLLAAVFAAACSNPTAEPAAEQKPDVKQPVKTTGLLPNEWKARFDSPITDAPDRLRVESGTKSLTFTPGPAAIYYKTGMKAEKDYALSAAFSQLTTTTKPEPYGLIIGGADLDKDTARYTAFLIRSDGKYQISSWTGATPRIIVDWKPVPAMREPKGVKTSNSLTIRAQQGAVHFLIAEREVHQMPRADTGPDGIVGVRIGEGLHVQVDMLKLEEIK
jgi:hypothetical protein